MYQPVPASLLYPTLLVCLRLATSTATAPCPYIPVSLSKYPDLVVRQYATSLIFFNCYPFAIATKSSAQQSAKMVFTRCNSGQKYTFKEDVWLKIRDQVIRLPYKPDASLGLYFKPILVGELEAKPAEGFWDHQGESSSSGELPMLAWGFCLLVALVLGFDQIPSSVRYF